VVDDLRRKLLSTGGEGFRKSHANRPDLTESLLMERKIRKKGLKESGKTESIFLEDGKKKKKKKMKPSGALIGGRVNSPEKEKGLGMEGVLGRMIGEPCRGERFNPDLEQGEVCHSCGKKEAGMKKNVRRILSHEVQNLYG